MHFQLRTDNHIENSEELADRVRTEVEGAFAPRYADQLRRIEVYLQDTNSHKNGIDKRCTIELHLAGMPAIAVHDESDDLGLYGIGDLGLKALVPAAHHVGDGFLDLVVLSVDCSQCRDDRPEE